MSQIRELEGKKIAILGLGASQIDYVIGVENSAKWITDEHEEGSYDYKLKNLDEDKD